MYVIACADLHNGGTANYDRYHNLLRIVEREKPHYFVKVGDGLELAWRKFENIWEWQPSRDTLEYERFIATKICPVIEIPGNHNPPAEMAQVQQYIEPIKVGDPLMLFDNVVYIHGDQFDPSCRWWWNPLQKMFDKILPCLSGWLWGTPLVLKQKNRDISYTKVVAHIEADFQIWLNGRSGIFGHTHSEFIKSRRGQFIANAGDFFDSCSFLRVRDGKPSLDWA